MKISRSTTRPAVTLLELLVVIGIMLALAALAAGVLPALRQKNNSAKAAAQVQGFLSISKQQAIRDRAPRGIRLVQDPLDSNVIRSLQYIEVPDPTRFEQDPNAAVQPFLVLSQTTAGDTDNFAVQIQSTRSTWDTVGASPGDYLMVSKNGNTNSYLFEIQSTSSNAGGPSAVLKARSGLQGLFPPPMMMGSNLVSGPESEFMVIRRARPLVGEPAIQLPPKMTIDLRYCAVSKPTPPAPLLPVTFYDQMSVPICLNSGFEAGQPMIDILFGADGELLGTVSDKLILCVKPEEGAAGEPTLVVIYGRTGAIILQSASVNVLPPLGSFAVPSPQFDSLFGFTEDGASSGL